MIETCSRCDAVAVEDIWCAYHADMAAEENFCGDCGELEVECRCQ